MWLIWSDFLDGRGMPTKGDWLCNVQLAWGNQLMMVWVAVKITHAIPSLFEKFVIDEIMFIDKNVIDNLFYR